MAQPQQGPLGSLRLQLMSDAVKALLMTLQPDQESDAARRLVVADMQQLVAQALPPNYHCTVETFGSFRAGLHLPGSDLDFALQGWVEDAALGRQVELHEWSANEQTYLLKDLADALEREQLVQGKVERVLHARVPVIKFKHALTGLPCDFSIHRPECGFKADMQKLLGSLDRRYASLYRLVKAWAGAHGLNDAASNTLNSWSLGLMVALYLQCEVPAVLPPMWQLLEASPPSPAAPRVLQLPGVSSAMLKRVLNHAATGAGAFIGRRARGSDASGGGATPHTPTPAVGDASPPAAAAPAAPAAAASPASLSTGGGAATPPAPGTPAAAATAAATTTGAAALNPKGQVELLLGFLEFFAPRLADWAAKRRPEMRASVWWGGWVDAGWAGAKGYIFSIEDPFHAGDNTARSVGTHNHLASSTTASYVAACFAASAELMRRALSGPAGGSSSSSPVVGGGAAAGSAAGGSSGGGAPASSTNGSPASDAAAAAGASARSPSSSAGGGGDEAAQAAHDVLAAFGWLFGPGAVLTTPGLPAPLTAALEARVPQELLATMRAELAALTAGSGGSGGTDAVLAALGCSSGLVNNSNSSSSLRASGRAAQVEAALQCFRQLAGRLGCGVSVSGGGAPDVCLGDFVARRRAIEKQELAERERQRQQWLAQQQQLQKAQHHQVMAAMRNLSMGGGPAPPPPAGGSSSAGGAASGGGAAAGGMGPVVAPPLGGGGGPLPPHLIGAQQQQQRHGGGSAPPQYLARHQQQQQQPLQHARGPQQPMPPLMQQQQQLGRYDQLGGRQGPPQQQRFQHHHQHPVQPPPPQQLHADSRRLSTSSSTSSTSVFPTGPASISAGGHHFPPAPHHPPPYHLQQQHYPQHHHAGAPAAPWDGPRGGVPVAAAAAAAGATNGQGAAHAGGAGAAGNGSTNGAAAAARKKAASAQHQAPHVVAV